MANTQSTATVEYRAIPELPLYGHIPYGYEVGDDGTIWSRHSRSVSSKGGGVPMPNKRIGADGHRYIRLKGCVRKDGYITVTLWSPEGGNRIQILAHRLVLHTFVGPCPEGMEVCHNNGIKSDNRLVNLRYDTHIKNMHDKFTHGTIGRGEMIGNSKLTDVEVLRIRRLVDLGVPKRIVAKAFAIEDHHVGRIVYGDRWGHLAGDTPCA